MGDKDDIVFPKNMLLLYRHEKKDLSHKKIYLKLTVAVFSTKFRFFLETSEVGSGKKLKNSLPKKIDIVLDHETIPKREFSFGNKWAVQEESLVPSCDEYEVVSTFIPQYIYPCIE